MGYCVEESKPCMRWAEKYFNDCLCNPRDEISFGFGIASLVCWGVAEVPQIITNFRTKSSHGVSLLFLLTWIAGDILNIVGCLLEPATLPTQLYTALLYTASTVVLVLQNIYYDHIYRWWKVRQVDVHHQGVEDEKKPLKSQRSTGSGIPIPNGGAARASPRRDFYYTSARSLAGSATPPVRSYLWPVRSGPSALGIDSNDSSSEDETIQVSSKITATQPKQIPRSAGYAALLATSVNLPSRTNAIMDIYAGLTGRKLLSHGVGMGTNAYGQWFGWIMAAIYMGGRIPQIILNIRRGSVEVMLLSILCGFLRGLNPLMFIFALIANVAYVGSILVRTTEWDKIKANLPWLLDAVVCVALDLFIILQYIYYRYMYKRRNPNGVL